jgi:hypothetical protein
MGGFFGLASEVGKTGRQSGFGGCSNPSEDVEIELVAAVAEW